MTDTPRPTPADSISRIRDSAVAPASFVHVVPVRVLAGVCAALLVLTVVTVAATYIDVGSLSLWVAMAIATAKAALVVLYFMHLRYDKPLYALAFVAGLFFVALFIALVLLDTAQYMPSIEQYQSTKVPM